MTKIKTMTATIALLVLLAGCGKNQKIACLDNSIDLSCCKVKGALWTAGYVRFEFKKLGEYQISCETTDGKPIEGKKWNFTHSATNLSEETDSGGLASGGRLGDLPDQPMVIVLKDLKTAKVERHTVNINKAWYDSNAPSAYP